MKSNLILGFFLCIAHLPFAEQYLLFISYPQYTGQVSSFSQLLEPPSTASLHRLLGCLDLQSAFERQLTENLYTDNLLDVYTN